MKKLLLILTVIMVLVSSCTEDKSNTELLTGTDWRITAWTVSPAILGITDWYANMEPCEKDDSFSFNSDGSASIDEGASKCDPDDPQTETGTWSFNSDETLLTIIADGETQSWEIIDLTNKVLKIKWVNTDPDDGTTYTFTITFGAI
ncbi:MAG: DUF5004 domain-containing protein [Sphingobacteriales bacterium]|nr:MAG: DUF5004 domain-containing protein [Sphingobacteriales bacterium]